MVNVLSIFLTVLIVSGLGGGLAYIVWLKTRRPKETYRARVYQLSGAVRTWKKENGALRLEDLKEYRTDTIDKITQGKQVVYRLQGLNLPVPYIESRLAERWGNERWVSVLVNNGQATLLDKGFDIESGKALFRPIPVDDTNLIIQQSQMRKDRNRESKGLLQSVMPWIGFGIIIMGTIAIVAIVVGGLKDINEKNTAALERTNAIMEETSKQWLNTAQLLIGRQQQLTPPEAGKVNEDKAPPSIE